ncbi:MAG: twin-arginine translocase TatA/TatE family subunit [Rhodospirillales bacterium]|nr:twin-arginine translocase TatA/TatE family subunit [Rhodospirillales bacterium]MBO6786480.1 twin-arginine translocase TatA/TatE family subunit [Rhodospirillales bacterium]
MGAFSIWHWIIVLAVVLILFGGKGKISGLMGDFGKGLKSFKKGMKDDDEPAKDSEGETAEKKAIDNDAKETVAEKESEKDKAAGG